MLKLVSVNIEHDKYANRVKNLIQEVAPNVLCLQEVSDTCVADIAQHMGADFYFSKRLHLADGGSEGVGIITTLPAKNIQEQYYYKTKETVRWCDFDDVPCSAASLLSAEIEKDGKIFTIATTHFLKSGNPVGEIADDFQRINAKNLLSILNTYNEVIFTGDLNAPRGFEIFSMFSAQYIDAVPATYTTSIDPQLHRSGGLPYMVDCLFITPQYQVTDMYFLDGISDHYAVVAEIKK